MSILDALHKRLNPEPIQLNAEQLRALELARQGKSFCLTGAAGTGKSTTEAAIMQQCFSENYVLDESLKYIKAGAVGVAICAYTNRAVRVARSMAKPQFAENFITLHKLLEFELESLLRMGENGNVETTWRFMPQRNEKRPLPKSLRAVVIDEASMLGTELEKQLLAALHKDTQIIYVGDINQLPPVMQDSAFGYRIAQLPCVELKTIYRQGAQSAIITLANAVLDGTEILTPEKLRESYGSKDVTYNFFQKRLEIDTALQQTSALLEVMHKKGTYNPQEDCVLIPYNKAFGSVELNLHIASFVTPPDTPVYEINASYNTHYFAVGDKLIVNKEDCVIKEIHPNPKFSGIPPKPASTKLTRWGVQLGTAENHCVFEQDLDSIIDNLGEPEKETAASHIVVCEDLLTGQIRRLSIASDYLDASLGYVQTCHKAQGSQWEHVIICMHHSNATMLSREWLYTAVTRAAKRLTIVCEKQSIIKCCASHRIPGKTALEKAAHFRQKVKNNSPKAENM